MGGGILELVKLNSNYLKLIDTELNYFAKVFKLGYVEISIISDFPIPLEKYFGLYCFI